MRAALHGLARGLFVVRRAQDQDQGVRRGLDHLIERLDAPGVGQGQVEQDHLDAALAQSFERFGEPRHPFDAKRALSRPRERLLDQSGFGGIVLDEKYGGRGIVHGMDPRLLILWPRRGKSSDRGRGKRASSHARFDRP